MFERSLERINAVVVDVIYALNHAKAVSFQILVKMFIIFTEICAFYFACTVVTAMNLKRHILSRSRRDLVHHGQFVKVLNRVDFWDSVTATGSHYAHDKAWIEVLGVSLFI